YIGQHRTNYDRQEHQAPRRPAHRAVKQERRVGRVARDRPIHVIDCEIAHARPARISSAIVWSAGLSTSTPARGLDSSTGLIVSPILPPSCANTSFRLTNRSATQRSVTGPRSDITRQAFLRSCSTDRHNSIAGRTAGDFNANKLAPVYAPPRNLSQVLCASGKRFISTRRSTTPKAISAPCALPANSSTLAGSSQP